MILVAVADDQHLVRAGLRAMLDNVDDMALVGEAADGRAAVDLARRERPDVLLMDVRMPVMDGIEATRRIASDPATAGVKVVVLTTFDVDEYVYGALRAGASGFLLKDAPPEQVFTAVRVVAAGDALIDPTVTRRLIAEFTRRPLAAQPRQVPGLQHLTEREREVLALVGRGLSNAEIAAKLVVSHATAKTHVARVFAKLQARDRAQLVVLAYESGLVQPGST
ncbi:MAG TPA: response regulator transcription factor [Actinoplanes sp.]|jgi:DNA-binding NarL/FixJ family response regulator|nr:response regulator transcription factor [Actinoplanes sp.]